MYNLLAFLRKYQFFALFLILEIISFLLLSNSYTYHKSLQYTTVNNLTGNLFSSVSGINEYFSLKSENESLLAENVMLRNRQAASYLVPDSNLVVTDSIYAFFPAKVVSNSVSKQNNFMLINKGLEQGIEPEMGVISSQGIAGIVVGTSSEYARVMSILHRNTRISARIKKNNQLVNVIWKGENYAEGLVIDIPSHIELQKGDSIVTSGNSLIFPEGINIGTVLEHHVAENKTLGQASLKFSTDFNSLRYVYIIKNKMKPEQDSLMNLEL